MKGKKTIWEIIKFIIVSLLVTIIQLVLVNLLFLLMKGIETPMPGFLGDIFNEEVMGEGHNNLGYVLPFFLSNLIANIYGYFQNRKTTFKAASKKYSIYVYVIIVITLIVLTTWIQGLIANLLISTNIEFFVGIAPTVAALVAGSIQLIVLFPLEKYVLFKKKEEPKENKEDKE